MAKEDNGMLVALNCLQKSIEQLAAATEIKVERLSSDRRSNARNKIGRQQAANLLSRRANFISPKLLSIAYRHKRVRRDYKSQAPRDERWRTIRTQHTQSETGSQKISRLAVYFTVWIVGGS